MPKKAKSTTPDTPEIQEESSENIEEQIEAAPEAVAAVSTPQPPPRFDLASLKISKPEDYKGLTLMQCEECSWSGGVEELMDQQSSMRTISSGEQRRFFKNSTHPNDLFCPMCRNRMVEHDNPVFDFERANAKRTIHREKMSDFVAADGSMTGVPRKFQGRPSEIDPGVKDGWKPSELKGRI